MTIIGAFIFIVYKEHQLSQQQAVINSSITEFKQLQDNIARSQSQYATKDDLDKFAKQNQLNLNVITKDLATLNATITGINVVVANSNGSNQSNLPSTTTIPNSNTTIVTTNCDGKQIPCPNADPFGYMNNHQSLDLNEQFSSTNGQVSVPIGIAGFSAWQQNPWDLKTYPRSYSVINVLGTDVNDKHYVYNKFTINSNGKDYPVQISNAKFEEEFPAPGWDFLNPRLYLGASAGLNVSKFPLQGEFIPGFHYGMISYGNSKISPIFSIAEVGIGYGTVSKNFQVEVSPIQYNVGQNVSFIHNTYVGPSISIGTNGSVSIDAGIRVGL